MNSSNVDLKNLPISEKNLGSVPYFENTQSWIYEIDNPYLHGAYAPTTDEIAADELTVIGNLPDDLLGAYYRNGPNPIHKPNSDHHHFDGDGMVHAIYFRDGKASYRNSYVHTSAFKQEAELGRSDWPGVMNKFDFSKPDFAIKDTCNTDVVSFAGSLLPTWYNAGIPYKMDLLTLENQGIYDFEGRTLSPKMSAHAHVDPQTKELLFMDYGDDMPFMTYGVANPDGSLRHEVEIELPGPRLPHDIGFSTNYTILHDLPFFHDMNVLRNHGLRALTFYRDIPARFGVIPRYGDSHEIRWFDCEPCFVLHISNCWEQGDWIIMDGCRSVNPMPQPHDGEGTISHMLSYMRLEANNYRWRFNLKTGEMREGDIDDANSEFNVINQLYRGIKSKYAYHQRIPLLEEGGFTQRFTALMKYNNETGQSEEWPYGDGIYGSEAAYAPRKGATHHDDEDDGYLVTVTINTNDWTSQALVFDAKNVPQGPIARVQLPQRVPAGFHACWERGEALYS